MNDAFQGEKQTCLTSNRSNMADAADMENTWTIAFVGNGASKKDEYLIINRATKTFLTCSGEHIRTDCKANLNLGLTSCQHQHPLGTVK